MVHVDEALAASDDPVRRRATIELCWREADEAEGRWLGAFAGAGRTAQGAAAYRRSWARLNHVAGLPRKDL